MTGLADAPPVQVGCERPATTVRGPASRSLRYRRAGGPLAALAGVTLPAGRAAHEPPAVRDGVRLLVGRATGDVSHHRFTELPELLTAGDVLVVNRSGTLPAAVDAAGAELVVHFSTVRPDGRWLVELRRREGGATAPHPGGEAGDRLPLAGGGSVMLRSRYGRLWLVDVDTGDGGGAEPANVRSYLLGHGRPIRYAYVERDWPLSAYQTVFATVPGSAEMPSASRPFTTELVTRLVAAGVVFAPVTLHTGVASLEAPEPPYPEWYDVPPVTARLVNEARAAGQRVIAIGTTAVRAIETAAAPDGTVRAGSGWTELVVTPERGVYAVAGLLTGFHEPQASHLQLLVAVAGEPLLARCYTEAVAGGYRWHEFGDLNLLLSR